MLPLLKYFKGYRLAAVLGPLFKLVEALLELVVPMIVAVIIDQAIPSGQRDHVLTLISWMFAIAVLGLVFANSAQYFSAKAAVGFTRKVNEAVFHKILSLDQTHVDQASPASLINRVTSDSLQVQTGVNIFFRLFLRSPFIVAGSLVMACLISIRVTAIFSLMILALFIVVAWVARSTTPLFQKVREGIDHLVLLARQDVQGMRVIRAFNQEDRERQVFKAANDGLYQDNLSANNLSVLSGPLTYFIVNLSLIMILWQGGGWVNQGLIQQGQLVALVNYLLAILVELVKLAMVVATLNKSLTSANRISQVLALEGEALYLHQNQEADQGNSQDLLTVKDLSFYYPGSSAPALENINFSIKPGQFIGIIGSTGAGKSALIDLILQNFDYQEGCLQYSNHHFDLSSKETLRQAIAWVPQKPALFRGTVASNLRLANPQASEDEMWQALKWAQAADFVAQKQGLETVVESFGRNFSGGQRQRLTLARALVKNAQLYIFDDSTSALDYLTESAFQAAIGQHLKDKTILMVSQRTHSVKEADNILVLEAGKQLAFNRHDWLLDHNAIYRQIHESQTLKEVGV